MNFKFSDKQLDRLSEFLSNFSLVCFAAVISPIFVGNKLMLIPTLGGFLFAVVSLIISLIMVYNLTSYENRH